MNIKKKDVKVFLICLGGAFTLWLFNVLNRERTEVITYPIQFAYDNNTYVALEPLPKDISLSVKGTGWQIMKKMLRIRTEPITYNVPSNLQRRYILGSQLTRRLTSLMDGVIIQDIITDTIPIGLDRIRTRSISLKIDSSLIALQDNYRVMGNIFIQPNRLTLTGPERFINRLPDPYIVRLSNRPLAQNFQSKIPIDLFSDKEKKYTKQSTDAVWVKFNVARFITQEARIPIKLENFPNYLLNSFTPNLPIAEISYTYDKKHYGKVDLADFEIIGDFENFRLSDSTVSLQIKEKPDFIQIRDIDIPIRINLKANE